MPDTSASPSPKLASIDVTFRLPVTVSAVKRMPAACGKTTCCTTTAMLTFRWSKPLRRRYVTARSVKSDAQHLLTCWRIAAGPTTLRYVSCWPANEAVGKSSAVALDRTAYAACSPSEHVIAVERSPGTEMFSITARTTELSARL